MATKLFISFSGLLVALKSGKIPLSDLDTALFYFGCTRDHAYNPSKHGVELDEVSRIFRNNPEEG
ncbi:hypothetical protein KJ664_00560, partial [Patescibacteria group bacterium]|nr:hypothetical protein [Patescibacteria group bacterium]